ncbi:unnamed protein product [Dimorphilus gyrociliatus]|uniref:Complex I assembly factor TIMMDC1, mitochondrial n=1 Tax=Dimorphilus gyrociliatus TaxID=2664684 RepID=A0A7I8VUI3_9ANNE|nr:unnamed protein product [Dimorphilus gyrociliatus]
MNSGEMPQTLPKRLSFLYENDTEPAPILLDNFENPIPNVAVPRSEIRSILEKESGMQRLKSMYNILGRDKISEDLRFCSSVPLYAAAVTFGFTAGIGAKQGRDRFIERNKATKFDTQFRASRASLDQTFVAGLRTGFRWFAKTAIFSGIFLFTSSSIAVYRNESSLREYVAGGSLTAAILRSNLGLRGVIAGGTIGGFLGLIGGSCILLALKASDYTQEVRHYMEVYYDRAKVKEGQILQNLGNKQIESN